MFKQSKDSKEVESVIGQSVKIKGNFGGKGDIIVEGIVEGNLKSSGTIFIQESAKISAGVKAESAIIKGEVKGNVSVENLLEIGETAKITGDISCKTLSIASGAILNGKCEMNKEAEKKEKPDQEENKK